MRLLVVVLLFSAVALAKDSQDTAKADLIFVHGNIYTGVKGSSGIYARAHAMAIRGDRILSIGEEKELLKQKGPQTEVIDLHGQFVMPGFNDAHCHLAEAGFEKVSVNLIGTKSLADFRDRVRVQVQKAAPGEWITGGGWDQTLWSDKTLPARADLDDISGDHPVFLQRVDGHIAVANSKALQLAKITLASKDPLGGHIDRDENGDATGILRDTATDAVFSVIPPPTHEKRRKALEIALTDAAQWGVTSAQDNSSWEDFQVYEELEREGKLPIRITEWLPFDAPVNELNQKRGSHSASDPMLHTGMLKAFMDGSLGSRTAALLAPYSDDPKNSGLPRYEAAKLNDMARERADARFQMGFHAIGDRGVKMALDAFDVAEKDAHEHHVKAPDGSDDYRFRVEHAQVTNPAQVAEFKRLGVIASMQPNHLLTDMRWAQSRLGPARAAQSYAWAEFLKNGVRLAFGTDYPVEPITPFRGLYAAVTRRSEDGKQEYFPEQKLDIDQAIAAYTTGSAYAEFAEKEKGGLQPGMLADFVVLDRDITAVPPLEILKTRVLRTVVGGRTVYLDKH